MIDTLIDTPVYTLSQPHYRAAAPAAAFVPGTGLDVDARHALPGGLRPEVAQRLRSLADLGQNWNSYGARVVSAEALRLAIFILQRADIPTPTAIVPLASGGVQLEWDHRSAEIEIGIQPDGVACVLIDQAGEMREEESPFTTNVTLRDALRMLVA